MSHKMLIALIALALVAPLLFTACNDDDPVSPPMTNSFALSFNGTNERVYVPDNAALDIVGPFTLSAWYYHTASVSDAPALIQKDGDGSWGRYGIWIGGSKLDFCLFPAGASVNNCIMGATDMALNTWNHIAATYDGVEMKVYLNGVLDGTMAQTGAVSTSDRPLYIGADPTEPSFLPGRISDVRIWDIALSAGEIQAGMFTRLTGSEPSLVGYWPMDDGSGQMAEDLGPNGLDAILGISTNPETEDPGWVGMDWPLGP